MRDRFAGWAPFQLRLASQNCRWLFVGDARFTEPFFDETAARCLSFAENAGGQPRITPLDELPELAAQADALEPSVLIFHVSRCGSTLISQLLGLDEAFVTVSEAPFFDQLLRARFQTGGGLVNPAVHLPAAIRLYGQRRTVGARTLVVKLDSWHTGFYSELRGMYPRTPFVLLYRHPVEVIDSHRKRPGMHAVPGLIENSVFGFGTDDSAAGIGSHLPRVLASYYARFLKIAQSDPLTLLLPYRANMIPAMQSIARFCQLKISASHREKMQLRAAFHAKRPDEKFYEIVGAVAESELLMECVSRFEELEGFRESQAARG